MTSSSGDVLNIKNLSMRYPKSNDLVLDGFSLKIRAGERVALIGSSGSGKSTIAKALMQILPSGSICKGELLLNGKDILRLNKNSLENMRGELVGFVFQDPRTRLNPLMTVGEHILDTLKAHQPNTTVSWRRKQAKQLLLKVGLSLIHI